MRHVILERIREGYYSNTAPFPAEPHKPPPIFSWSDQTITAHQVRLYADRLAAYESAMLIHESELVAWHRANQERGQLLRIDLETEMGLTDHPLAQLLWSKVERLAEFSGQEAIYWRYLDLCQLIKS